MKGCHVNTHQRFWKLRMKMLVWSIRFPWLFKLKWKLFEWRYKHYSAGHKLFRKDRLTGKIVHIGMVY